MKWLISGAQILISNLQGIVSQRYLEERYLQLAPIIFLVLEGIWKCMMHVDRLKVNTDVQKMYSLGIFTLLFIMLSIGLSYICVLMAEKMRGGKTCKWCAYEKIKEHYYLKNGYEYSRDILSVFSSKGIDLIIMFASYLVKYFWKGSEKSFEIIGLLFVYGGLKYTYLSGATYNEVLRSFATIETRKGYPLYDLWYLASCRMKDSIYQMKKFHYHLLYGIDYPGSTFSDKYKELYFALKNEENIFVENAFYHDWGSAFIIPLHLMLLRNKKVVIFAGASMNVEKMDDWLRKNLQIMLEIGNAWDIKIWEGTVITYDICIVPFERISEFIRTTKNAIIMPHSIFCVIMEPSRIVAEMKSCLEDYADYLSDREISLVYCFADRYIEGLMDYLEHVFRCRIKRVEIALDSCKDTIWCISDNSDTDEVKSYWGTLDGSGCGAVYFNEMLHISTGETAYVSERIMPLNDLHLKIKNRISLNSQEDAAWASVAYDNTNLYGSIWDMKKQERQFIVADDENCNCYDLYSYLSTRGEKLCAVFLLSGKYFLLDFMVAHIYLLQKSKQVIPFLFPAYQNTDRNRLLKIIRRAAGTEGGGVKQEEVYREFPEWKRESSWDLLKELNRISKLYYGGEIFRRNNNNYEINSVFLKENSRLWEEIFLLDGTQGDKYVDCVLACHLNQRWLEGQYIVYGGRYYQVGKSREGRYGKEIPLQRSGAYLQSKGFYYQNRLYEIWDVQLKSSVWLNDKIVMEKCSATIKVQTGEWSIKSGEIYNLITVERRDCIVPVRKYQNKELLFTYLLDNDEEDFYNTLRILLEGMCRTLYPYHYPYLGFKDNKKGLYIIEDCEDDIGLLESVEKNMEKILNICYEYAKWYIQLSK